MALFACVHTHNPSACAWSHVELVKKTAHSTTKQTQKNNANPKSNFYLSPPSGTHKTATTTQRKKTKKNKIATYRNGLGLKQQRRTIGGVSIGVFKQQQRVNNKRQKPVSNRLVKLFLGHTYKRKNNIALSQGYTLNNKPTNQPTPNRNF
jgi:hypothetical protein